MAKTSGARSMRHADGRTIVGIERALAAALADEVVDNELREQARVSNYTILARARGLSRQRVSELVDRAYVRQLMIADYRAGRTLDQLARSWHGLYPRGHKKAKRK